jgi:hypothetical protein
MRNPIGIIFSVHKVETDWSHVPPFKLRIVFIKKLIYSKISKKQTNIQINRASGSHKMVWNILRYCCEIRCFHGGYISSLGLPSCEAVHSSGRITTFQRSMLNGPPKRSYPTTTLYGPHDPEKINLNFKVKAKLSMC